MIMFLSSIYKYKHISQIYKYLKHKYIFHNINLTFLLYFRRHFFTWIRRIIHLNFQHHQILPSQLLFQQLGFGNSFSSSKIQNHVLHRQLILENCIFMYAYHNCVFFISKGCLNSLNLYVLYLETGLYQPLFGQYLCIKNYFVTGVLLAPHLFIIHNFW